MKCSQSRGVTPPSLVCLPRRTLLPDQRHHDGVVYVVVRSIAVGNVFQCQPANEADDAGIRGLQYSAYLPIISLSSTTKAWMTTCVGLNIAASDRRKMAPVELLREKTPVPARTLFVTSASRQDGGSELGREPGSAEDFAGPARVLSCPWLFRYHPIGAKTGSRSAGLPVVALGDTSGHRDEKNPPAGAEVRIGARHLRPAAVRAGGITDVGSPATGRIAAADI